MGEEKPYHMRVESSRVLISESVRSKFNPATIGEPQIYLAPLPLAWFIIFRTYMNMSSLMETAKDSQYFKLTHAKKFLCRALCQ